MCMDINKVLHIALNEVGYCEKSKQAYINNPQVLYHKTQGAGSENYTKYGAEMRRLYPQTMDFPAAWCDCFVDWCMVQAYGTQAAKEILCGNFDDYTVNSCKYYERAKRLDNTPTIGAQVFFTKNGRSSGCYHTGLVYDVDANYFYTVEGNTSNSSAVVANGGCVAKKKYSIKNYRNKVLFGHPRYDYNNKQALKSIDEIAQEVIALKWGNGKERERRLTEAGYNYQEVRKRVNEILSKK